MRESKLYFKFQTAFLQEDPDAWIYKIPDTFGLGGKRPADIFLITKSISFLIEMKIDGKPTKFQQYKLNKFEKAGGKAISFDRKKETIAQLVSRIAKIRNEFLSTITFL
jgi:hypothetical protein